MRFNARLKRLELIAADAAPKTRWSQLSIEEQEQWANDLLDRHMTLSLLDCGQMSLADAKAAVEGMIAAIRTEVEDPDAPEPFGFPNLRRYLHSIYGLDQREATS